ncbi:MAG: hypothetical protein A3I44_06180 [Candidatus Sungbacteria bacterium RIFCSPLOWO2_02_FULL_51_17]|uniref:Xylose isomerase-like TIM barrel domain-containing protein n=1 Tax=Candidatus Sungbacteria bacterium RIFCSPHIGHO2_02_FULL_51_29 TaxID=1802273 RepID=A0A1G2KQC2_9BACT|nr:MAG: hypothetical protein A2676_04495 [Candidatus Sungbacteria bacterium RIFCSPHIGHO2_01_FULL_51_22]OHA01615.1 MAG: hypothetical protein A3C16_02555 [Candidatus Sungbacteria bacterium RIFCSPHIGHO2_02_FULL_51_29]OHA06427.1 MAG: hypothetical protein A3B29_04645 [Candidatus Sungbacteria bacterium RIFCSPLOWO2_01_FULL_51_34]OHA10365.1 MAG: hypothetical protein A3I44_06180 [Candidatus Sungbacteria bacterium RIFCSPLOWO2_02_FULL_51_17]
METTIPLLGAHVSSAGGLHNAIDAGEALGADVIQIFGASPRQWTVRIPAEDARTRFLTCHKASTVQKVYLHGAYLVNLASPDAALRERSEKNLSEHFMIATALGAEGLIFHIGSGQEMPREDALTHASEAMRRVLAAVPGSCQLIIENTAGGGQKLGSHPDEIARIRDRIGSDRVKACLDTQHAFAGGLIEEFNEKNIRQMLRTWDDALGLEHIVALHVNDSKTKFNSRHDRHENLGQGFIGLDGFRNLGEIPEIRTKAWILEVPGFTGKGPDQKNMELLRSCFSVPAAISQSAGSM